MCSLLCLCSICCAQLSSRTPWSAGSAVGVAQSRVSGRAKTNHRAFPAMIVLLLQLFHFSFAEAHPEARQQQPVPGRAVGGRQAGPQHEGVCGRPVPAVAAAQHDAGGLTARPRGSCRHAALGAAGNLSPTGGPGPAGNHSPVEGLAPSGGPPTDGAVLCCSPAGLHVPPSNP